MAVNEFLLQLRFHNYVENPVELRDASHDYIIDEHFSCDLLFANSHHICELIENVDEDSQVTQGHRLDIWIKMP